MAGPVRIPPPEALPRSYLTVRGPRAPGGEAGDDQLLRPRVKGHVEPDPVQAEDGRLPREDLLLLPERATGAPRDRDDGAASRGVRPGRHRGGRGDIRGRDGPRGGPREDRDRPCEGGSRGRPRGVRPPPERRGG